MKIVLFVKRLVHLYYRYRVVRLKTKLEKPRGKVLLSYIVKALLLKPERLNGIHSSFWECRSIAQVFLEFGYDVDVINFDNYYFKPKCKYNIVFDIHFIIEHRERMFHGTTKLLYATGAHWLFQNHAEYQRLKNIQARRSAILKPNRTVIPTNSAKICDHIIVLGNEFTKSTFATCGKPLHTIRSSTSIRFEFKLRDFKKTRNNFIWFGGTGLVHKGLDIVLDVFAKKPECNLYVIGDVASDSDFMIAYKDELALSNVRVEGWLRPDGERFRQIVEDCCALIHPSCSEGQAGSVIVCIHAGLIPVVSRESGVDVGDFGIELQHSSDEEISSAIDCIRAISDSEFAYRSRSAYDYAINNHTQEVFLKDIKKVIREILRCG